MVRPTGNSRTTTGDYDGFYDGSARNESIAIQITRLGSRCVDGPAPHVRFATLAVTILITRTAKRALREAGV